MPNVYEIEQYEICITKYRVEASSEAEAIAKLFDGGADAVDNSHEYIETAEDCGLPADEYQELAAELWTSPRFVGAGNGLDGLGELGG